MKSNSCDQLDRFVFLTIGLCVRAGQNMHELQNRTILRDNGRLCIILIYILFDPVTRHTLNKESVCKLWNTL